MGLGAVIVREGISFRGFFEALHRESHKYPEVSNEFRQSGKEFQTHSSSIDTKYSRRFGLQKRTLSPHSRTDRTLS
jgi:hypothetical protein